MGISDAGSVMADKQLGIILLSGGLDSTTAAAWAIDHGMTVSAVSFDYGQTHRRELQSATEVAKRDLKHSVVDVTFYRELPSHSALTKPEFWHCQPADKLTKCQPIPSTACCAIPSSLPWQLPGSKAKLSAIENDGVAPDDLTATLIIAANAIDYSGPDCRPEFITRSQKSRLAVNLARSTRPILRRDTA